MDTTEPSGPVRATARVGAVPPRRTGAVTLRARRRPGHLGPIHVLQIMLIELIVVAIPLAAGAGSVALGVAVVLGLVLAAATLARRGGRWWWEQRVMSWQFHRRRNAEPLHPLADARLAAMQTLAPGLTVDDVSAPDGSQVGVAIDDAGWYAVAELHPDPPMYADDRVPLPLDRLVTALAGPDRSGRAVVQVVTHTVPVPEPLTPAGAAYHSLLGRVGPHPLPVDRRTWLAVRLDARALAEMGAEAPEQAPAMVSALLRHLTKTLRRSGITARVLDREELLDALDRSCDLLVPGGPERAAPHEEWDAWYSHHLVHRTFWVQDWPVLAQAGDLLAGLSTVPAALTSVAIVLNPNGDGVDVRCLTRFATTAPRIAAVSAEVRERAHLAKARLLALDGDQGPALYATAPTGGGPR